MYAANAIIKVQNGWGVVPAAEAGTPSQRKPTKAKALPPRRPAPPAGRRCWYAAPATPNRSRSPRIICRNICGVRPESANLTEFSAADLWRARSCCFPASPESANPHCFCKSARALPRTGRCSMFQERNRPRRFPCAPKGSASRAGASIF